jgi:hypothetical protein
MRRRRFVSALVSYADLTSRHLRVELAGLECLLLGRSELLLLVDCHHPEAGHRLVVVTLTLAAVALDEWSCAEVLQARSGTGKGLTTTTMTDSGVLEEKKLVSNVTPANPRLLNSP